jgi:hypothetical protein
VSTQLGHASVQMTADRYERLFPDERRGAGRRLQTMLAMSSRTHPAKQDVSAVAGSWQVFSAVVLSGDEATTSENTR